VRSKDLRSGFVGSVGGEEMARGFGSSNGVRSVAKDVSLISSKRLVVRFAACVGRLILIDEGEIFLEEESQSAGMDFAIRRERENSVICV
jgi:hypothetical protein